MTADCQDGDHGECDGCHHCCECECHATLWWGDDRCGCECHL